MATIITLSKKGKAMKIEVMENVAEIWAKMNGDYGPNGLFNERVNREYLLLTDIKGRPLIFHTRYMWKIVE